MRQDGEGPRPRDEKVHGQAGMVPRPCPRHSAFYRLFPRFGTALQVVEI